MFDEKFFRMWEFYLAGCEAAFKWGDQVVYQFQLTKELYINTNSQETIFINNKLINLGFYYSMKKIKKKFLKIDLIKRNQLKKFQLKRNQL